MRQPVEPPARQPSTRIPTARAGRRRSPAHRPGTELPPTPRAERSAIQKERQKSEEACEKGFETCARKPSTSSSLSIAVTRRGRLGLTRSSARSTTASGTAAAAGSRRPTCGRRPRCATSRCTSKTSSSSATAIRSRRASSRSSRVRISSRGRSVLPYCMGVEPPMRVHLRPRPLPPGQLRTVHVQPDPAQPPRRGVPGGRGGRRGGGVAVGS